MFISKGNKKVKANIFNLPTIITCGKNLKCHKFCYARKAERLYPQVLPCRMNNLKESKDKLFITNMINELSNRKNKIVRIHESGEFYSKDYIQKWFTVCNKLPKHKFYAYTKRADLFTKEILKNKPNNLTLIYSYDGLQSTNSKFKIPNGFDKASVVHETKNNCPANVKDSKVVCMVDCKKCLSKRKSVIIFKKH